MRALSSVWIEYPASNRMVGGSNPSVLVGDKVKIDHHRTHTVHMVAAEQPDIGTITTCGIVLPHSSDTSSVSDDAEVDCGNCVKTLQYRQ